MDNLLIICLVTVHIGYITSLCNQNQAQGCLSHAQQQLDTAAQNQNNYNRYCSNYLTNAGVSECVRRVTASCNKQIQETYRVQAEAMLKQVTEMCIYYERLNAHEETYIGNTTTCDNHALLKCHTEFNTFIHEDGFQNGARKSLSELFQYVNPAEPSYFDQLSVCRKIEDFDFATMITCVNKTGCGNESALGKGHKLTVIKLLELTEGICQPGCDSIKERLINATSCYQFKQTITKFLAGNLEPDQERPKCSEVDTTVTCIRNQVSFCEAAKDYLLLSMQIPAINNNVQYHCPDVDLSLMKVKSASISTLNRSSINLIITTTCISTLVLLLDNFKTLW